MKELKLSASAIEQINWLDCFPEEQKQHHLQMLIAKKRKENYLKLEKLFNDKWKQLCLGIVP